MCYLMAADVSIQLCNPLMSSLPAPVLQKPEAGFSARAKAEKTVSHTTYSRYSHVGIVVVEKAEF